MFDYHIYRCSVKILLCNSLRISLRKIPDALSLPGFLFSDKPNWEWLTVTCPSNTEMSVSANARLFRFHCIKTRISLTLSASNPQCRGKLPNNIRKDQGVFYHYIKPSCDYLKIPQNPSLLGKFHQLGEKRHLGVFFIHRWFTNTGQPDSDCRM